MADYTPIGDGEMIADQPITQALITRLRDNPIAIIERAAGAPTYGWTVTQTGNNANGYYRVWDDAFKVQWGYAARTGTQTTVTLPVSFEFAGTMQALAVHSSADHSGGGSTNFIMMADFGLSTIKISHGSTYNNIWWLAWGY